MRVWQFSHRTSPFPSACNIFALHVHRMIAAVIDAVVNFVARRRRCVCFWEEPQRSQRSQYGTHLTFEVAALSLHHYNMSTTEIITPILDQSW